VPTSPSAQSAAVAGTPPDADGSPPPTSGRHVDNPARGILLVLAAGFLFTCSDAISKVLATRLPAIEIAWLRWSGFLLIVLPIVLATRGAVMRSGAPIIEVGRGICMVTSSVLFVAGLGSLPLASATTINFVSPLLVTALSIPLLGEKVGPRRWAAVLVGLSGVVIIIRPGGGGFGAAALFPLASAAIWALGVIATRRIAAVDGPWTAMTYSAITGFALLSLLVPEVFIAPTGREFLLAAALSVASTAAQFCIIAGFRYGSASLLAPFTYVSLIWATALGFVLFGNLPDGWTWVGAAVIVASGIYTAHRERVRAAAARVVLAGDPQTSILPSSEMTEPRSSAPVSPR
jgi:drug/metabolite transporter (DMT)-like permease